MTQARDQDATEAFFLRNIPAKCNAETLRNFLESKGLTNFQMDMALFPNGKSRGYAVIRVRARFAVQNVVDNIHGQFIPGFHKPAPLCWEPLMDRGPPRCAQSPNFVPAERPQPLPLGACGHSYEFRGHNILGKEGTFKAPKVQAVASLATTGTGVPKSEPGRQLHTLCSLADGTDTAFALPSQMAPIEATMAGRQACLVLRHEPACTIMLSAEGKIHYCL
ncbi:unnamed protein product [Symbiodinium sp. CCMP2456]|nr:unnamed protein product [Symbiodinium sp. CCMP2456]